MKIIDSSRLATKIIDQVLVPERAALDRCALSRGQLWLPITAASFLAPGRCPHGCRCSGRKRLPWTGMPFRAGSSGDPLPLLASWAVTEERLWIGVVFGFTFKCHGLVSHLERGIAIGSV